MTPRDPTSLVGEDNSFQLSVVCTCLTLRWAESECQRKALRRLLPMLPALSALSRPTKVSVDHVNQ